MITGLKRGVKTPGIFPYAKTLDKESTWELDFEKSAIFINQHRSLVVDSCQHDPFTQLHAIRSH